MGLFHNHLAFIIMNNGAEWNRGITKILHCFEAELFLSYTEQNAEHHVGPSRAGIHKKSYMKS